MDQDRLLALRARLKSASTANLKASEEEHKRLNPPVRSEPDASKGQKDQPLASLFAKAKPLINGNEKKEAPAVDITAALPSAGADKGSALLAGKRRADRGTEAEGDKEGDRAAKRPRKADGDGDGVGEGGDDDGGKKAGDESAKAPLYAFDTADRAQRKLDEGKQKEENSAASFSSSMRNEDIQHRSYAKSLRDSGLAASGAGGAAAGPRSSIGSSIGSAMGLGAGAVSEDYADEAALDRLSAHLTKTDEARRRQQLKDREKATTGGPSSSSSASISSFNTKFNNQLGKSMDKYTAHIKQAIERGSAI